MPPAMPDYRIQARRRMKRGLLPQVVAAADPEHAGYSTGQLLTNNTGNARQGQQYRDVVSHGNDFHVYADGTRVPVFHPEDTHLSPARRTGFAPNTGQSIAPPAPLGSGHAPTRPVEGTGQRDEAALAALVAAHQNAVKQQMANQQMVHPQNAGQMVPKVPAPGMQAQLVAALKARGLSPRRRNRRRLTGGMLAP